MATTRGPVSTEVDSPLAQSGIPTPSKLLSDGQGFRPLGLAAATPRPAAVDTTLSLGPARATSQAHNHVPHLLSPLQHLGGHLPGSHSVTLPAHLSSPHLSAQRPQQHIAGGAPRQHPHHPVQMVSAGLGSKVSRSQVEIRRRDGPMELSRAHPIVTRPVANHGNMGQPVQGSPGGNQLGKPQGLMPHHRPQGTSPQDKVVHIQKPTVAAAGAQRQVIQRAHTRTANWQTPLGQQHTPGTPSRMFHPHPVLNSQARSSPQEQARQHPVLPQQFSQQTQLRDLGPVGIKSLPMYPALRTPVSGNHASNHNDTSFRERLSDRQIVVHIGDRKVRLVSELDSSSLYSLCRRWMRNDIPRPDRTGVREVMNIPLPRPLSVAEVENAGDYALDNGTRSDNEQSQPEIEKPVDSMTDDELLLSHVQRFKTVRKRSKEERMRNIARFKPRLALLLPGNESG